jgi:hypothetical protein
VKPVQAPPMIRLIQDFLRLSTTSTGKSGDLKKVDVMHFI